jgi:(R,R)-butanediol dehydrogenase/meso-butanediol dehydrogenase/diacetyl reductase
MLKASYVGEKTIEVTQCDINDPAHDEVQIEVAFVGLCGTDLHIIHGNMDNRVSTPLAFGHEMSGVITGLGGDVSGWLIGEHVTVMPLEWDGTCPACLDGYQHICQNLNFVGIDSPGALSGVWNVKSNLLVRLPKALSLTDAALVEPVAVAVHDVIRSEAQAGQKVVILGGGPIGVLIASVLKHRGIEARISEIDAGRRKLIEGMGLVTIDPGQEDLGEFVSNWTSDKGADIVFEVSGAASAVTQCTQLAKVRGRIVIVAIHGVPREVNLQRVFWRELEIVGVRVYERSDFEEAINLLLTGAIPTEKLITKKVPITEINSAVSQLESGQAMKILIDMTGRAK